MLIGELSTCSGVSRDTIRYYEKLSLLSPAGRREHNDYKHYGQAAVQRLRQIQQLKAMGFTLREIRQLLGARDNSHPCAGLPVKLEQKLAEIDRQVAALLSFKASLTGMQAACDGACATPGGMPECVPRTMAKPSATRCC
jgi:DNA-binding transcriptional MerR regulator